MVGTIVFVTVRWARLLNFHLLININLLPVPFPCSEYFLNSTYFDYPFSPLLLLFIT